MADDTGKPGQQYQPEQTGMYELEFPAPQLSAADGRGPVLIHALEGFSDAGRAIRLGVDRHDRRVTVLDEAAEDGGREGRRAGEDDARQYCFIYRELPGGCPVAGGFT